MFRPLQGRQSGGTYKGMQTSTANYVKGVLVLKYSIIFLKYILEQNMLYLYIFVYTSLVMTL
jgi:hypothetical protein